MQVMAPTLRTLKVAITSPPRVDEVADLCARDVGYLNSMWEALEKRGWTRERFERMLATREAIDSVTANDKRKRWVVDWVTTLPEYRKMGLVRRLLDPVLKRGS